MTDFTTKDSGSRASYGNGGVRDTQDGKPRFDLILPLNVPFDEQLLTRVAGLMARGAEKYTDRNWEQFSDQDALDRAKSSAMRHFMQWITGETDEDHAAAVMFNIMAADYVTGVLDGKWEAQTAPEQKVQLPDELWRGGYSDPEPPEHVTVLQRVGTSRHITRRGDWWYWEHRPENGFRWSRAWKDLDYVFEEVRNNG